MPVNSLNTQGMSELLLAIDQDGNIHRFFSSNKDGTGIYHWSGSTGDKVPLGHKHLGDFNQELKLLKGKL